MTAAIEHIVFDIGKVLIHWDPTIPYQRIIPDQDERRWFFENVCTHDWNMEQDRGREWPVAEAELIEKFPDHADNIKAFRKHWHEMVVPAYHDSVAVMEGLIDQGHDVTMLTNFAADTFRHAREMYLFLNKPRGVTVSGEVRLIKPDIEIYQLHTREFGLDPSKTLFIDDTAINVEGAKRAGWHAVQFTGVDALKADLARFGFTV